MALIYASCIVIIGCLSIFPLVRMKSRNDINSEKQSEFQMVSIINCKS